MNRFFVASIVCGVLLAGVFVFSVVYAQTVSITTPSGTWYNDNFQITYDAKNVTTCTLETIDGIGGTWIARGTVPCGDNQTMPAPGILTGNAASDWCTTTGAGECGVRIIGTPGIIKSQTFTGANGVPWTLPPGASNEVTVDARGSQGAAAADPLGGGGGKGGRVQTTIDMNKVAGNTLFVYASYGGGDGIDEGGGGGHASDIRTVPGAWDNPAGLNSRLVVAGGGGGQGASIGCFSGLPKPGGNGGAGGNDGSVAGSGERGFGGTSQNGSILQTIGQNGLPTASGGPGREGTQTGGGQNGGAFGKGGDGIEENTITKKNSGGGGGGGWYGGGGGGPGQDEGGGCRNDISGGGGGGGSNYVDPNVEIGPTTHTRGFQTRGGEVIITWEEPDLANTVQGSQDFNIDVIAPVVDSFTATDGTTTVDLTTDPLIAITTNAITLNWNAADAPGGSGLGNQEIWRAEYVAGTCDDSDKSGCSWNRLLSGVSSSITDNPSYGEYWYSIRAYDQSFPSGNCVTETGAHCGGVTADGIARSAVGPIWVQIPVVGGLVPCGRTLDAIDTNWNETKPCELRHTFLLVWILVDFALWKLAPLIIAAMVVYTGAVFYFSFGGPNTLARARGIWRYIGIGVLVLLFSWLLLNLLLGVFGFNVNVFGRWYQVNLP